MELPSEIWSVIFSFCDGQSLASSVRCVCNKFRRLEGDETLWKSKCTDRKLDVSFRKPDETWKQFYLCQPLQLFPLYGVKIGKTTAEELKAMPAVTVHVSNYVTLNKVNFWFNNADRVFKMMYLVTGLYILPKEWEDIGINYKRSWDGYLTYFKYYFHNYQIKDLPCQYDYDGKQCFTAAVRTISKCDDIYFELDFNFEFCEGDENSKSTLYSISVDCPRDGTEKANFKELYENNVIDNQGYVIKDEQNQFEILRKELMRTAPKIRPPKIVPPVSAIGFDSIPMAIWTDIFGICKVRSITTKLSLVCKLFKEVSEDDALWERKCMEIDRDPSLKLSDETWKKYYFMKRLALFPLYGVTIDKTTEKELIQHPDAVKAIDGDYFTINNTNFWVNNPERICRMIYIARGIHSIPDEWLALGINWERSFKDYLTLFKRSTGNYQMNQAPRHRSVEHKSCFEASVQTIVRQEFRYYAMKLVFGYDEGTVTSTNTLCSIAVYSLSTLCNRTDRIKLYEDHVIVHKEEEDLTPPKPEPLSGAELQQNSVCYPLKFKKNMYK